MKYNFTRIISLSTISRYRRWAIQREYCLSLTSQALKVLIPLLCWNFVKSLNHKKDGEIGTVNGVSTGSMMLILKISTLYCLKCQIRCLLAAKLSTGGYTGTAKDLEKCDCCSRIRTTKRSNNPTTGFKFGGT
jgi:hypothetical protein